MPETRAQIAAALIEVRISDTQTDDAYTRDAEAVTAACALLRQTCTGCVYGGQVSPTYFECGRWGARTQPDGFCHEWRGE
jgi:hypothetical protein